MNTMVRKSRFHEGRSVTKTVARLNELAESVREMAKRYTTLKPSEKESLSALEHELCRRLRTARSSQRGPKSVEVSLPLS